MKFQLDKNQQNCLIIFNISVNFKNTKKVGHILESSLDVQSFYDPLYAILLMIKFKDDIQVVSQFPRLLGHPVVGYQTNKYQCMKRINLIIEH